MYNSTDYIDYHVFNEIEDKIFMLNSMIKDKIDEISFYEKTTWSLNDVVYIELVEKIEEGIKALKNYYASPVKWIEPRVWKKGNSFSYVDINRWISNLNAIEKLLQEHEPIYCGSFFSGEEVCL